MSIGLLNPFLNLKNPKRPCLLPAVKFKQKNYSQLTDNKNQQRIDQNLF